MGSLLFRLSLQQKKIGQNSNSSDKEEIKIAEPLEEALSNP